MSVSIAGKLKKNGRACLDAKALAVKIEELYGNYTLYYFQDGSKAGCYKTIPCFQCIDPNAPPVHLQAMEIWEFFSPKQRLPIRLQGTNNVDVQDKK